MPQDEHDAAQERMCDARRLAARVTALYAVFALTVGAVMTFPIAFVVLAVPGVWIGCSACIAGAWVLGALMAPCYYRGERAASVAGVASAMGALVIGCAVSVLPFGLLAVVGLFAIMLGVACGTDIRRQLLARTHALRAGET